MEAFGELREDWLGKFLELPNGIPSHDTFRNVFSALDPDHFLDAFLEWTESVRRTVAGEVIGIDGKALRGAKGVAKDGSDIPTIVGAWAAGAGISLGQLDVEGKSNERERSGHGLSEGQPRGRAKRSQITAVPKLLDRLKLKGAIVTTDAMGCQKQIAKKIRDKGADYVLALKGNQGSLHTQVQTYLDGIIDKGLEPGYTQESSGHGREEVRRCWVEEDLDDWLEGCENWDGLHTVVAVELRRTEKSKTSVERRYFISNLEADAEKVAHAVRAHWRVENSLHWVLDVVFGEDAARARTRNAAGNLSTLRRLAQNLLKTSERYPKWTVKKRKFAASQNPDYLLELLGQKSDA